jgi:hypothetical protein
MTPRAKACNMPSSANKTPHEPFDPYFIAGIPCILATAALVILTLVPSARTRFSKTFCITLGLYLIHSAIHYAAARLWQLLFSGVVEPWTNMVCAIVLVALSSNPNGTWCNSTFSFSLILMIPFQRGVISNQCVALTGTFLIHISVGLGPSHLDVVFRHVFVRHISFLLLEYITSSFGKCKPALKRRLALLNNGTRLVHPHLGMGCTIGTITGRLRAFCDADACIILMVEPCVSAYYIGHIDRCDPEGGAQTEPISYPQMLVHQLLMYHHALVCHEKRYGWRERYSREQALVFGVGMGTSRLVSYQSNESQATMLGAQTYIPVLLHYHNTVERFFLIGKQSRSCERSDGQSLLRVINRPMPTIHNIRLMDRWPMPNGNISPIISIGA